MSATFVTEPVECKDCGKVRLGVTVATFVCRFCLSMRGRKVRTPRTPGGGR